MTNTLDELAKLLPEGLSESGMEEISGLVDGIVKERVDSEVKGLEAKVSGYLRMKIDELKDQARKELENDDDTFRAVKVYESLKSVIAEDIESSDSESAVSTYKEKNAELEVSVQELNSKVSKLMSENHVLEESVGSLREDYKALDEVQKAPFKSSEKALVITNENVEKQSLRTSVVDNAFLTEDVIRLSKNLNL